MLEVSYTSAGKDGILRIDDHGKPFVLIALGNAVGYLYAGGPAGLERDPELDRPAREGSSSADLGPWSGCRKGPRWQSRGA